MKRKVIPVIVAVVLILVVIVAYLGVLVIQKFSYSKDRADLSEYFKISSEGDAAIILQDNILAEKAIIKNGVYYIDFKVVQTYFNNRFYADTKENLLLYTTPTDIISAAIDSNAYNISGNVGEESYVIATYVEETLYVAVDYVKKYTNFSYQVFTGPDRIQVYTEWSSDKVADIKKDTAVRYQGGVKSDILADLKKGDNVVILEELENWSKIKTNNSIIGYVENKRLENTRQEEQTPVTDVAEPVYANIAKDYKINLAWHQVTNLSANALLRDALAQTKAVNTISPTWFSLSDNEGNFTSLAAYDYVAEAHNRGIEVWGLVDNFNKDVDTNEVLSYTSKRAHLIQGLVNTAIEFNLDGINVDFESISTETGENYIEFIRELSIACRANGIILSVDNYVPKEYSSHYNRKEQGIVADYVIVMGYDEHYSGGGVAGSVASIDFVEEGIQKTIEEVPAEKVINAVPFYTRIWKTTSAGVTSENVAMGVAEAFLAKNNAGIVWNEETCQNYGEFQDGENFYQVWLEDAQSLEVKLNIMRKYNLAGVAEWKLTLENADVWNAIEAYVSGW